MPPIYVNLLSLVLLVMCAYSWARQVTVALIPCSALFLGAAGWATVATFYTWSPVFTIILMACTLLASLVAVAFYVIDVVFAPFCLEMTYLLILCWILCPLLVVVDFAGLAFV